MFIISATVPCTKKKSKVVFFPPGVAYMQVTMRTAMIMIMFQWCLHAAPSVSWMHMACSISTNNLGAKHSFTSHRKNEQETSQNLKKGNPICYPEKVKTYSPKQIRKDLSTQRTTSEDFHADTREEDFVVSWHLQKDQHYSLLLMCSMQHGSYRYTRYWESDSERSLKTYFLHWHSSQEYHLWNRLQPCTKTRLSSAELEAHRPCSELQVH